MVNRSRAMVTYEPAEKLQYVDLAAAGTDGCYKIIKPELNDLVSSRVQQNPDLPFISAALNRRRVAQKPVNHYLTIVRCTKAPPGTLDLYQSRIACKVATT